MKELFFIRHGKSDWSDLSLNDLDRPLKKRGIQNSALMAKTMKDLGHVPSLVISSPAVRAFQSAKIFANSWDLTLKQLKVDEKLYMPDFPTLIKVVLYLNDDLSSVGLVGHEPSFSEAINHFLPAPIGKITTASITWLSFDTKHWRDLDLKTLKDAWYFDRHKPEGIRLK